MKYSVGDLFVTENKKVIHLVVKVHFSLVYTEWYNVYTKEKGKSNFSLSIITKYLATKTFKHYPVKK